MRRRFKLLAVLMGAVALLVLLVLVVVPMLVDSDRFKREAIALVRERSGHTLHIDGDVRLHLFPGVRITVTHIRIASPPGFASPDLARLPWLMVDLKPLPLLRGRVEANAVDISGLRVNLERDRTGRGNWQSPSPLERDAGAAAPLAALALGGVEMRDGAVHWRDRISDTSVTVSDIRLETGALHAEGIDAVRLQARLPEAEASFEVRGDIRLASTGPHLSIPDLRATFGELNVAGMRVDGTLDGGVALDFASQRVTLDPVRASVRASGNEAQRASVQISTALDVDLARQRLTARTLALQVPAYSLSGFDGTLALTGALSGDLGTGIYALEQMQGTGTVRPKASADPQIAFALTGALSTDLERRRVLASGLEISGNTETGRLPFRFLAELDMSHRSQTLTATDMRLTLADWQVDGNVTLHRVASPRGVRGAVELTVRDQGVAGSFAVRESPQHEDALDVRADAVADLDMRKSGYRLRGKTVVVLDATVLAPSANDSWRVGVARLAARLDDASLPRGTLSLELQGDVDVDPNKVTAQSENLRLMLDESHIAGAVSVRGFDTPAVHFDLEADAIDADRYLPVGEGGDPVLSPGPASIAAIRALDMAGELRVRRLTLKGTLMENVRLTARGRTEGG
ncbi:MAG: AsmA family protein [Gammaproteobacteria bacterium]|nr:AsmA family protein [Gammaproteobacteria bacterium]NIM74062.1 AsmA family protein [Gammaproteobacteria bacterium]NIN38944.1 AsmA family protein [Gammaproteobacteria bacterium]NIO25837.1 AsmA family protein [Gammaproteobacteria bacterium]NIO66468.1 AsmA family protein [Gammaproteobacteria bacterium]